MRTPWLRAYSTERSCSTPAPEAAISSISSKETTGQLAGVGDDPRVGAEDAGDVGVDLADARRRARRRARPRWCRSRRGRAWSRRGCRSRRPGSRRRARSGPRSSASRMRSARTSMIRALVWEESVTIPACEPVSEIASWPMSWIAIAQSAQEIRSPVESSMSISRATGRSEISCACGDQLVGRLAARREHRDDAVARLARGDDPPRGALDLLGAGDRGAAELHHDDVRARLSHGRLRIVALKADAPVADRRLRGAEDEQHADRRARPASASCRAGACSSPAGSPPASRAPHTVEHVAGEAVAALHESFDYYLAVVQRLDPDGSLRVVAGAGPLAEADADFLAREQPVEVGVNGRVARTGRPAMVNDTRLDPDYLRPQPAHRPRLGALAADRRRRLDLGRDEPRAARAAAPSPRKTCCSPTSSPARSAPRSTAASWSTNSRAPS